MENGWERSLILFQWTMLELWLMLFCNGWRDWLIPGELKCILIFDSTKYSLLLFIGTLAQRSRTLSVTSSNILTPCEAGRMNDSLFLSIKIKIKVDQCFPEAHKNTFIYIT